MSSLGAMTVLVEDDDVGSSISSSSTRDENRSNIMRKPAFCICKSKTDQLRGDRRADQPICFHYMDGTISL